MPSLSAARANEIAAKLKDAFDYREFTGTEMAPILGLKSYHGTGTILLALMSRNMIDKTKRGYRLSNGTAPVLEPTISTPIAYEPTPIVPQPTAAYIKAGGYYIASPAILIAGTHEKDKVVLYTSIIEIDGVTKLSRNKRIVFTKQQEPDEYAAVMAHLRINSATPDTTPEDITAALQLAEEASAKLALANKEIESLKTKIAQFRAVLGE